MSRFRCNGDPSRIELCVDVGRKRVDFDTTDEKGRIGRIRSRARGRVTAVEDDGLRTLSNGLAFEDKFTHNVVALAIG